MEPSPTAAGGHPTATVCESASLAAALAADPALAAQAADALDAAADAIAACVPPAALQLGRATSTSAPQSASASMTARSASARVFAALDRQAELEDAHGALVSQRHHVALTATATTAASVRSRTAALSGGVANKQRALKANLHALCAALKEGAAAAAATAEGAGAYGADGAGGSGSATSTSLHAAATSTSHLHDDEARAVVAADALATLLADATADLRDGVDGACDALAAYVRSESAARARATQAAEHEAAVAAELAELTAAVAPEEAAHAREVAARKRELARLKEELRRLRLHSDASVRYARKEAAA